MAKTLIQKLRRGIGIALFGAAGLVSACGPRSPPNPNDINCMGGILRTRTGYESQIFDRNCDGKVDEIFYIGSSGGETYLLDASSREVADSSYRMKLKPVVIMTPVMQALADSIYSMEKRFYFLEDSVKYWGYKNQDTTNLTNISFKKKEK